MKKALSLVFALVMLITAALGTQFCANAEDWKLYAEAKVNCTDIYQDGETLKIPQGNTVFITFQSDEHNWEHGITNIVGWSDGYEGGTLSSVGFDAETGTGKSFGYDTEAYGLKIGTGKLEPGAKGTLEYYVYEIPADGGEVDFINTPIALTCKLKVKVVKPEKPKNTKIKNINAKSKGFTVSWKKASSEVKGYQFQYATNSKFTKNKKTVTVKKRATVSKSVKGLKAKKKYFVRIRTYKTVNGKKVYSSWSKAKTVTTKK
jgi:hypothetical protein